MASSATGELLRAWRTRRRYSQLDLALAAQVSTKHLSYIETGRARPSAEMILHLTEHLSVPLRARNEILASAGFAPRYRDVRRDADSDARIVSLLDDLISTHPYPTVAVDDDWNLVTANAAAAIFLVGVAAHLLVPPINVIRLSLHPDGLASRVDNFAAYAAHVCARIRSATARAPSRVLDELLTEFAHLEREATRAGAEDLFLTLDLTTDAGVIRFFSTITIFGAPRDVALDGIALETFHPADDLSRARWSQLEPG